MVAPLSGNGPIASRSLRAVAILVITVALALAFANRFVQDDAFISFVYADAWVHGDGLTWFGEHVEGYTNFLWVAWIALGLLFGIDPVTFAFCGSFIAFALMLWGTWRLALRVLGDGAVAVLAVVMTATNFSVSSYASGGLETMWQCLFFVWILERALYADPRRLATGVAMSLAAAALLLIRLDSAVILVVAGFVVARRLVDLRAPLGNWLAWTLPGAAIVGVWAGFKLGYYGNLLPNTYYAKAGPGNRFPRNGLVYLWRFALWYWVAPVFALGTIVAIWRRQRVARIVPLVASVAAWCVYVAFVGGDFMEFRFLVPVAPFLFIVLAAVFAAAGRRVRGGAIASVSAAALVLGFASWRHARTFRGTTADYALDSIPQLASFYGVYRDGDWSRIGRALAKQFGDLDILVALHAAGAIPYYSHIRTLDMWGLNDPWIAHHGTRVPASFARPGHRCHATLDYLERRGVQFVIGHPTLIDRGLLGHADLARQLTEWRRDTIRFSDDRVATAHYVAIPVSGTRALLVWYLTPTPALDRRLEGYEQVVVEEGLGH